MENKNNTTLYFGIGAVVILAVILFWSMTRNKDTALVGDLDQKVDQDIAVPTEDRTTGSVNKNVTTTAISYADALIKYTDKRIQLDKNCQAFPNLVTYKDNTGIMIDNRAPVARTVKIGTDYTVKAYGFKIIVLPDIYLQSKTILVDCDAQQNVATIIVQE